MFAGGDFQRVFEPGVTVGRVHEVGQYEGRRTFFQDIGQVAQPFGNVRAVILGHEADQLLDDHQHVRAALFRRDELFDAVAEEDAAYLVVVLRGGKGQHGGDLGDRVFLELFGRAEHARTADVDQQHHRQLALFLVDLDVRLAAAGGDVPVDIADVVAHAVFAHFAEGHTAPFESAVVFAGEDIVAQPPRLDLDPADLFENIAAALHDGLRTKVLRRC